MQAARIVARPVQARDCSPCLSPSDVVHRRPRAVVTGRRQLVSPDDHRATELAKWVAVVAGGRAGAVDESADRSGKKLLTQRGWCDGRRLTPAAGARFGLVPTPAPVAYEPSGMDVQTKKATMERSSVPVPGRRRPSSLYQDEDVPATERVRDLRKAGDAAIAVAGYLDPPASRKDSRCDHATVQCWIVDRAAAVANAGAPEHTDLVGKD